jgi:hypothetical protein
MLSNSLRNGTKIHVHELEHRNILRARIDTWKRVLFIRSHFSLRIWECQEPDLNLYPKQTI